MAPYLPRDGAAGSPYSEGGALLALGLIHANHGSDIRCASAVCDPPLAMEADTELEPQRLLLVSMVGCRLECMCRRDCGSK